MESLSWEYSNPELNIQLNKISNLFNKDKVVVEGDINKGSVSFLSEQNTDSIFGSTATIDVNWEKIDPTKYHHGRKVRETIRMFSTIQVVASRKETRWHLSHEMTYWFGQRQKIVRKRFYSSQIIHGIMLCELTNRLFEFHGLCFAKDYPMYEQLMLDAMFSLQCHE